MIYRYIDPHPPILPKDLQRLRIMNRGLVMFRRLVSTPKAIDPRVRCGGTSVWQASYDGETWSTFVMKRITFHGDGALARRLRLLDTKDHE